MQPAKHDEVKNWVLAISMGAKAQQQLPVDERGVFEGSLKPANSDALSPACVVTGTILGLQVSLLFTYSTCSIVRGDNKCIHVTVLYSGYPVLSSKIEFKNPGRMANKEDWNKFLTSTKVRMCRCTKSGVEL